FGQCLILQLPLVIQPQRLPQGNMQQKKTSHLLKLYFKQSVQQRSFRKSICMRLRVFQEVGQHIFILVEAMEEAASELGLSRDVAKELIIQTVIGAGEMLRNTGEAASDLREKITSPAGTTEAGIEALNSCNFSEAVKSCVKKAHDRSIELGKQ